MTETRYASIAGLVVSDAAPAVTDDADNGYNRNTLWFDTATGALYLSYTDAEGAADWREIVTAERAPNATTSPKSNATAADPVVGDDTADGYAPGSIWINTSDGGIFICTDASAGAAVWEEVSVVP